MTRSNARELAVHYIFELGFRGMTADELLETELNPDEFALRSAEEPLYAEFPNEKQREYIKTLVLGVYEHCAELDDYISELAIGWKFSRLPRVAVAILRVAMYEMLYMPDVPHAAAINEAVEIAKGYEDKEVVSFINGILGTFQREKLPQEQVGGTTKIDGEQTP